MAEQDLEELLGGIDADVRYAEPMKAHTSLGIGGPVDALVTPRSVDALRAVLSAARRGGIPVMAVGGGTNLLVKDGGIEGIALSLAFGNELSISPGTGDDVRLIAGAGLSLQKAVGFCREKGLAGIEGLAGIPGKIGGAIAGNAGAYGCEIKDVLAGVTLMDMEGRVRDAGRDDIAFGYRSARLPEGALVLKAELSLRQDSAHDVAARAAEFLARKKAAQPLSERSAGCVFKNPPGGAAGRLIDEAGCKGMRIGGIEVSGKHANFFVNRGGGTALDYLALMEAVALRVRGAFGIELEPEIKVVGR